MAAPVIPFEEQELPRLYSEQARGGETFQVSIIGNRYNIHQRNVANTIPVGKWTIDFKTLTLAQIEQLRTFFIAKYGGGIGFRFLPPSNRSFISDQIGAGNGSQTVFPLYRKHTSGSITVMKRVLKPMNESEATYAVTVGGSSVSSSQWDISKTAGTITFTSPPSNGAAVVVNLGEFCVPVVFDIDTFESTDFTTFGDWSGVGLVELLPANLGLT